MLKILKKTLKILSLSFAAYLLIGNLLHRMVFTEKDLDVKLRPQKGFTIENRFGEKVIFEKTGSAGQNIEFSFSLAPGGAVPVYHVHDGIAETFAVRKGVLMIRMPDGEHAVKAGEALTIPPNTPHQPRNLSAETVTVHVTYSPGGRMDEFLTQFFGLVNAGKTSPGGEPAFLQMMLFSPKFGIYLAEPPVPLQKLVSFVLGPIARLAGHKSVYPEYFTDK